MTNHKRRNQKLIKTAGVLAALTLATTAGCRSESTSSTNTNNNSGGSAAASQVKPGPGFDGTTITLGVITPQTGLANAIGLPLTAGNELYVKRINEKGGIAGKYKVALKVVDSKYDPATGAQQYDAIKGSVVMLAQVLGTPVVDRIKERLAADNMLLGPASLDAFWVREPNMMPIGAPYQIQVINGLDYAVRKLDGKSKKISAMTKSDPYGQTVDAGLKFGAEKNGLTVSSTAHFAQGDSDFTAQINQLKNDGCQIVILGGLPSETGPILGKASGSDFAPMWMGVSPTWISGLANSALKPYLEKNFLLMAEGPNWGDPQFPGAKQLVDDVAKFAPDTKPDGYFGFGYAQMQAVEQILEKAVSLGDLSPKGVVAAATKIEKLTFGNTYGDYKYGKVEDRDPPRATTIFKVDSTAPNGTKADEVNFTSQPAKEYTFAKS